MSIPFMRGFPNGKIQVAAIDRPEDVEEMGQRFIKAGGIYVCEILTSGLVNMAAVIVDGIKHREVSVAMAMNGPELMPAVDRLVRQSVEGLPQ